VPKRHIDVQLSSLFGFQSDIELILRFIKFADSQLY